MSSPSVVLSGLASPALARPAPGSLPRAHPRLLARCSAQAGSAAGRLCRVRRGGARRFPVCSAAGGGAVGDAFVVEDTTNVKFPRELRIPGYVDPLVILGTGYRDKFFVKVYAAAFYVVTHLALILNNGKRRLVLILTTLPQFLTPFLKISISENQDPSQVDAEIKSATVNYALYDGFFGNSPVSPSLRSSTAQLLEALLAK